MRILAASTQQAGALAYRVLMPLQMLQKSGHEVSFLRIESGMQVNSQLFANRDFVILQKATNPALIDLVEAVPKAVRPMVVYEADDLIWHIPPCNPDAKAWMDNRLGTLECIRRAGAVVCSTERLVREVEDVSSGSVVRLAPNHIDFGFRNWDIPEERNDRRLTIGWFGGSHHYDDEDPIAKALPAILTEYPSARFLFAGDFDVYKSWRKTLRVQRSQFQYLGARSFEECPSMISHFDIGIAPLAKNRFNECKSDLKLIEYGAWGLPYVASDVSPYRGYHEDTGGKFGFVCKTSDQWEQALRFLIEEPDVRSHMGGRHRGYVREHRGPDACLRTWNDLLQSLERYRGA